MSGLIGTSHSRSKIIGSLKDTAKAWVRYNGETNTILQDFNVSSVTDVAIGNFDVHFAKDMSDGNYCVVCSRGGNEHAYEHNVTVGATIEPDYFTLWARYHVNGSNTGNTDPIAVSALVFEEN